MRPYSLNIINSALLIQILFQVQWKPGNFEKWHGQIRIPRICGWKIRRLHHHFLFDSLGFEVWFRSISREIVAEWTSDLPWKSDWCWHFSYWKHWSLVSSRHESFAKLHWESFARNECVYSGEILNTLCVMSEHYAYFYIKNILQRTPIKRSLNLRFDLLDFQKF